MKNSLLTIKKRRNEILDLLQRHTQMTTIELSEKLHVSLSTIRRDLRFLEEKMRLFVNMAIASSIMTIKQILIFQDQRGSNIKSLVVPVNILETMPQYLSIQVPLP
ncbi:DeoR family transcriptional regulator [Enterococcus mundtii]|nr:DeoR family transcriptional regulator [Enterococcus mundtii]